MAAPRPIRLHDTRTGELLPLEPRDPGQVGIYACGPTVYGRVHVGNARPYVTFTLLKRFLEHEGYAVTLVANVTDINDKIYDAARAAGVPSAQLAEEMTERYRADTDRLGLGRPDHEPLASETVEAIVALIAELLERGHAYACEGDVYFRVRSLPAYGELSHQALEEMDQGEGVEGAERKEDPADFALWKAHKPDEDTWWEAPWGRGRPGWHIECSAMAERYLGVELDVHGGGADLVFPHHENEAAQTLAARGRPLARVWMHNGMVQLAGDAGGGAVSDRGRDGDGDGNGDGAKMSKSVGNVRELGAVLDAVGRDTLLLYFAASHYRQPLAFSRERLEEAGRAVDRIREAGRRLEPGGSPPELGALRERFFDALADDFNTAKALAALYDWIREANRRPEAIGDGDLREMLAVLGLEGLLEREGEAPPEAQALAEQRAAARARRDWPEADRLRDELRTLGWEVRDGAQGPELLPLT